MTTRKPVQLSPLGAAFAGALGGCFSTAVVYPLDVAKTRIQADIAHKQKGMLDILLHVYAREGLKGWYRGFGATMVNTFSQQYAYFFFYNFVRSSYLRRAAAAQSKGKLPAAPVVLSTAVELLLGAIAGALAQIFTIPVSVIATRQQVGRSLQAQASTPTVVINSAEKGEAPSEKEKEQRQKQDTDSFFEIGRAIVEEDGYAGLWLGIKPGLVLTVNPAITYGVFERVKSLVILANPGQTSIGAGTSFLVGALSKTLATVVTYPYIMAKIRIQAKSSDLDLHVKPGTHPSAVQILSRVYQTEGFVGWYQGMQAQIIKAVISQALLFASKDVFEQWAATLIVLAYATRRRGL